MSKYKQKVIPIVDDSLFVEMPLGKLKNYISDYFNKEIRNQNVKNIHKGLTISITKSGLRHLLFARHIGFVKLKVVMALKEMLIYAVYCNFHEPDADDGKEIIGYFNFKCKVKVEGKK